MGIAGKESHRKNSPHPALLDQTQSAERAGVTSPPHRVDGFREGLCRDSLCAREQIDNAIT